MNDLTSSQLKRLTELLMNCAPFSNEHQLRTLFIDPRIRPWQHLIPSQPENFHDLTRKTIALLMGKYNRQQESALVLFLDVLADNIDEGDHCHEQVIDLALELRSILTITPPPPTQPEPQPKPTSGRYELYGTLENRFNDDEIRDLCFHLNVDYENLPGATKKDKARELIIFMENRNRLDELAATIQQLRPDITGAAVQNDLKELPAETPVQVQMIEAVANWLRLTLEGMPGKWAFFATNEGEMEISRVTVVLRPSPHVTVAPTKIPLGAIQPGQTRQASSPVVIRPNKAAIGDICVLPFEATYATPNTRAARYTGEFYIPILTH